MTFSVKDIRLTFKLGKGQFGESGYNTVAVSGLRVRADITQVGGATMGQAQIVVYGLTPDLLNQLTALWVISKLERKNSVTIEAGDENGYSTVFEGQISASWADLNAVPDSVLHVTATSAYLDAIKAAEPTSYPGSADVANIMSSLANKMNLSFENHGVSVVLSNPYLVGTYLEQVRQAAQAANIDYAIDANTLVICPKDGNRGTSIQVSAETGMVGYPAFNSRGIAITTLFNPSIRILDEVQVDSVLKQATGKWTVYQIHHNLESQMPDGRWFTHFQGSTQTII